MNRIKKGDIVIVRTGKDKNKVGQVLEMVSTKGANKSGVGKGALTVKDRVIVESINMRTHFNKPKNMMPGSIEKKEGSIHISNVALINPSKHKEGMEAVPSLKGFVTKVGYRIDKSNGKKVRFSKATNKPI